MLKSIQLHTIKQQYHSQMHYTFYDLRQTLHDESLDAVKRIYTDVENHQSGTH